MRRPSRAWPQPVEPTPWPALAARVDSFVEANPPFHPIADVVTRPVADAVPLFWRFMTEKFGITPNP